MADVIVLEFSAPNAVSIYNNVNHIIGWDGKPDGGHWPKGMLSHVAAESGDKLIVVEVWQSKANQEEFMNSQLVPAFAKANVPPPARVEWFNNVMDVHLH
jgi:hypothetical protein